MKFTILSVNHSQFLLSNFSVSSTGPTGAVKAGGEMSCKLCLQLCQ
ncbi:hypothetical protein AB996_1105 [Lactococcus cremoris]|uniref:Uncharacterized protein n=1 Tax=Lactococcus lactis subsp. cremoris TaxID=1359 RepID=A0A166JT13_LACLC|nr:hypothetical protein AB996_1105 [Lactococcus cremoris]